MMRLYGGVIGFLLLLSSVTMVVSGVPPSHEWFDGAAVDDTSVTGLVESGVGAAVEALNWSVRIDGILDTNISVNFFVNQDAFAASIGARETIDALLFFSYDALASISDDSGSYDVLVEQMVPWYVFLSNVSDFMMVHAQIIDRFVLLGNSSFSQNFSGQELLGLLRNDVEQARIHLTTGFTAYDGDSWVYTDERVNRYVEDLFGVLDRYDRYIDDLAVFFPDDTKLLSCFAADTTIFLGETLTLYGYCMDGSQFVSNHSITLRENNNILGYVQTDAQGRFRYSYPIAFDYEYGWYNFSAFSTISGEQIFSPAIAVYISRIPTNITLALTPTHIYQNETVTITGTITDYYAQGVSLPARVHIHNDSFDLISTTEGEYTITQSLNYSFGRYTVYAEVPATPHYQHSQSKLYQLTIDIPTKITLIPSDHHLTIGEDLVILGNLRETINGTPLMNQTITFYFGTTPLGNTTTNALGAFQFIYPTTSLPADTYQLSARFAATTTYRFTQSEPIPITLTISLLSYLPTIILIATISTIFIFLYMFRAHLTQFLMNTPLIPTPTTTPTSHTQPRLRFGHRIRSSIRRIHRGSTLTQDAIQDSIFSQYRMLIRYLITQGIGIHPTDTHLDIHQHMTQQGYPTTHITTITQTFEQAMYAPQPITIDQLKTYDTSIFTIMTHGGH